MTTLAAIEVCDLTHRYPGGDRPALDQLSIEVHPKEIFAFLGPNGGGKSTLFKILATMLRPTSGTAGAFGVDVVRDPHRVRSMLGIVFQSPSIDRQLTARENMRHQGHLYGLHGSALEQRIEDLLRRVELSDRADDMTESFSGGMRRRVELAKAMLHQPRLLLLDEPSTGLDPGARLELWRQLEYLRGELGITIALTTHLMDEADKCDRIAILHEGKRVAMDTPDRLKSQLGGDVIAIEARDDAASLCDQIAEELGPWPDQTAPKMVEERIICEKADGHAFVAALGLRFGDEIASIRVGRPTLDDVFMHLTGRSLWSDSPVA